MSDAFLPFKRYFQFSGRSRPREYWLFFLLIMVGLVVAVILDNVLGLGGSNQTEVLDGAGQIGGSVEAQGGVLSAIWALATFIPNLAVSVRRLHDIDRRGWWLLIGLIPLVGTIVLLVFFCTGGTRGPNRFGPDPLLREDVFA